ncbi:NAD(P)-binding protein [Polyplosphaeria fusca]|uniref:NAD(P)-binding protein n=1 Tax=Polyplosphaeria fusca TaxID=682080 RepID=A0A9P4QPV2_9PLEO|nr:NAD(P)-binding protein [Polyplosphaeria fusca]
MRRVLLTGGNTLIGSHILGHLLSSPDVSVRAVVASREDAQALQQLFPSSASRRIDFAIVSPQDLAIPGTFDDALSHYPGGFDTVVHTVTADPSEEADCLSRFINLETDTLINFLRSVKDVAVTVRRVVIITSLSPFARWLVHPQAERSPRGGQSSVNRFVEIDPEYVLATSQASDNIVHDALWKWKKDANAQFDLVSLTAPSIYGPSLRPLVNSSDLEEANRRIWNICSNDSHERMTSPPYGIDHFTDVRDLAFASVRAVFTPEASNRRFSISAGMMPSGSLIADFLISRFPELGNRVRSDGSPPRRPPSGEAPLEVIDTHLAVAILGMAQYRPIEETLTDLARQMLELHQRKEWKRVINS